MECKYCGKLCKNNIAKPAHERRCILNPNRVLPWNKGLHGDPRCQITEETKKKLSTVLKANPPKSWNKGKKFKNISDEMKTSVNQWGGYRKGSGRGKQGRYKNIWCDSSWELAWVIYHLDHNIKFERNTKKFKYEFNNESHQYTPDFYLIEDKKYIEVKGRRFYNDLDDINKAKISSFEEDLEVLYEKNMQTYIKYAENTYGKDYIKLYD